jgi:hypothetical protein
MARTNIEQRGGLSRRAAAAQSGARRKSNDELLSSMFGAGSQAQHFKDHPLDGPTILGAMPDVSGGGSATRQGPASMPSMTANDPVAGVGDWFKGGKTEGAKRATPDSAKAAPAKPPSLTSAIQGAMAAMAADAMLSGNEELILTGLPGDDYEAALDDAMAPPPSTY